MKFILATSLITALFIIFDLIWFSFSGNFFKNELGQIARLSADGSWNVRYVPALLVYVAMSLGVMWLVMPQAESLTHAALLGALFGLVGYSIFDLTNLAILSDWTTKFAIVDIAWGTCLCASVSAISYKFIYHAVFLG